MKDMGTNGTEYLSATRNRTALRRISGRAVLPPHGSAAGTDAARFDYADNKDSLTVTGNMNLQDRILALKSGHSSPDGTDSRRRGGTGSRQDGCRTLPASALIEAVVASTIFLIVFMLSLDTVSRITTGKGDDEYVLIEADHRAEMCFARYGDGSYPQGTYEEEFPWGKVVTGIERHGEYDRLQEITVRAVINGSRRGFTYKYIVETGDETLD